LILMVEGFAAHRERLRQATPTCVVMVQVSNP
jgi:hypothetical protein